MNTKERTELAAMLAQGGMPRLFWPGVEQWIEGLVTHKLMAAGRVDSGS